MTTVLSQAHIWFGKSLFGKVNELKLPDVEFNTITSKTIDGIGEQELPTGLKQMKTTISVDGYDIDVVKSIANPYAEQNMIVYGNLREFNGQTLTEERPVKVTLRASSSKFPILGTLKGQENTQQDIDLNVSAVKWIDNGFTILHIDVSNNIWIQNGVDMLERARVNLGLV